MCSGWHLSECSIVRVGNDTQLPRRRLALATNPNDSILSQFHALCSDLIDSARQAAPGTSAFDMERAIFKRLLAIGAAAMQAYFEAQAPHFHKQTATDADGRTLRYCGERRGLFYSVFGEIALRRSYYCGERHGFYAMDAALNLPPNGLSDFARMLAEELAVDLSYDKAISYLAKFLRIHPSTRSLQEAIGTDSQDVEAFSEQAPVPAPDAQATIKTVEADGKGIAMVRPPSETAVPTPGQAKGERTREGKTKEATVVSVSTHIPFKRTPEQVRNSLFRNRSCVSDDQICDPREKPTFKRYWATLEGKKKALAQARDWSDKITSDSLADQIALTDGLEALQRAVDEQFPGYVRILDLIHAVQYLWKASDAQFGKNSKKGWTWVFDAVLLMLQGKTDQIITQLDTWVETIPDRHHAKWKPIERSATYFEKNLGAMKYDEYLAKGWPIATGIIEGACRHVVKDRCEQSGMRWTEPGAQGLLNLRCVHQNGDWDAYHAFRMQRRHEHFYGVKLGNTPGVLDTDAFRFSTKQTFAKAA